ncbi:hypothetical protein LRS73_27935 [Methylobacterium currus]|uniref:hypothetical protein n=1 Tax=Methylobacterium currus TaxID=2051553 RepID=UPI000F4FCB11|nr:hypothetical protein [Methylobacterium currus]UHC16245.1 hypothetical protein LRS73_27935 [Methylobacterium currus]
MDAARRLGPGLARHAALIAAGELVQGVADAAFRQTGRDAHEGATARLTGMLVWLAEHRVESWLAPPLAARLRVASPHTGPNRGCALP